MLIMYIANIQLFETLENFTKTLLFFLFLSDKNECLLNKTRISVNESPQLLVLELFHHYICTIIV